MSSDLSVFSFAQLDRRLLAATSSGMLQSTDGGLTWTPLGPLTVAAQSLAVLRGGSGPALLLAGGGRGMMRSDDEGQSWVVTLTGTTVNTIGLSPDAEGEVIVLAGTETDGIMRSSDGGETWVGASAGLLDLEVLTLALSPAFTSDNTGFVGTATGLYRTRNRGQAWRWLPLPTLETAVQSLTCGPDFNAIGIVLVGTEADGLVRSEDGGRTWHVIEDLRDQGIAALAWADAGERVFAATDEGIARSDDAGLTWSSVSALDSVLALSVTGDGTESSSFVVAGLAAGGIRRSNDGARTWRPVTIFTVEEAAE